MQRSHRRLRDKTSLIDSLSDYFLQSFRSCLARLTHLHVHTLKAAHFGTLVVLFRQVEVSFALLLLPHHGDLLSLIHYVWPYAHTQEYERKLSFQIFAVLSAVRDHLAYTLKISSSDEELQSPRVGHRKLEPRCFHQGPRYHEHHSRKPTQLLLLWREWYDRKR